MKKVRKKLLKRKNRNAELQMLRSKLLENNEASDALKAVAAEAASDPNPKQNKKRKKKDKLSLTEKPLISDDSPGENETEDEEKKKSLCNDNSEPSDNAEKTDTILPADDNCTQDTTFASLEALGVSDLTLKAIKELGFTHMMEIQAKSIPPVIKW